MKSHPLIFSAPMVRALLDGSKTQRRWVVKPQPITDTRFSGGHYIRTKGPELSVNAPYVGIACPHGNVGDQLWVRETWTPLTKGHAYRADSIWSAPPGRRWRSSIHMPRPASRITLEIINVRVERLQDISEADCIAEGVQEGKYAGLDRAAARAYSDLWESINGPGSWDLNPWVWVIEFKRAET